MLLAIEAAERRRPSQLVAAEHALRPRCRSQGIIWAHGGTRPCARLGEALITLHLDDSWTFGFDHAKRRAGQCDYTKKRITVSRYLAARFEDDEIHQVLLA